MTESNGEKPRGRYWEDLTEEERRAFIERARKELPELDAIHEKCMKNLRRIAQGLRPIR